MMGLVAVLRLYPIKMLTYSRSIVTALAVLVFSQVRADNRYPIVLVHGFMGWGREEMSGYKYWGGFFDLEAYLEFRGYTVYTVSIGPVSSNWERAVEVYYQVRGGQVDYGRSHAERWGVDQKPKGKVYRGLYPEWDAEHPIHIIAHSMGGQTARMIQHLLFTALYSDVAATIPEESSFLGQSHEGWIKSITTIATPHNGTTLLDIRSRILPFLQYLIGIADVVGTDFYDFDLQQWGFKRENGESWVDYYRRMQEHPAWETKNISAWDLSLEGARKLNTILKADPNIYYFSFVTSATILDSTLGRYIPDENINFILRGKARSMGTKTAYWADGTATDSTWYENDGVVNTISQYGPTTGLKGPDLIVEYTPNEVLIPGRWYTFGPYRMDHWYILGHFILDDKKSNPIFELFENHCKLLWSLPE